MTAVQAQINLRFVGDQLLGVETVSLQRQGPQAEIDFNLPADLRVTRLSVDGSSWPLTVSGTAGKIALGRALDRVTLRLEYQGRPAAPSRVGSAAIALFEGSWHPDFAGAYPTVVMLAARPGWDVVMAGERQATDSSGIQTWRVDSSVSSGLFIAPHLPRTERSVPGLSVELHGAGDPKTLRAAADLVVESFQQLSARLGPPPHTPIVQIVFDEQAPVQSLGAEHALLVFRTPGNLLRPESEARFLMSAALAQHWPQVGLSQGDRGPRHDGDAWLAAGLPLMLALDAVTQTGGASIRDLWLQRLQVAAQGWQRPLAEGPASSGGSPEGKTAFDFAARACLTLNALRLEIGDDRFWGLLRRLPGPDSQALEDLATPQTMVKAVVQKAGRHPRRSTAMERAVALQRSQARERDLAWFWAQWLQRPDLPKPRFEWHRSRMPRSGSALTVRLHQSAAPFWFRAPIVIWSGSHRMVQWIQVRNADTVLAIPFRGVLDAVQFDPAAELLRQMPGDDE